MRRATPSSSMSAAAARSWSEVAMRTERPLSSWHRPPSTEHASKSRRATLVSALETKGSHVSTLTLTASQREAVLFCNMLIKIDKIPELNRNLDIFRRRKRVNSKRIFKPGYKDSERK